MKDVAVEHFAAGPERIEQMLHRLDAKIAERFAASGAHDTHRTEGLQAQLQKLEAQLSGLSSRIAVLEGAMSVLTSRDSRIRLVDARRQSSKPVPAPGD